MRKFIFLLIVALGAGACIAACARPGEVPKIETEIYYADAELNRLLPYDTEISDSDTQQMAEEVIDRIIEGRDYNEKIRRLVPKMNGALSVRVSGNIAVVDIKSKIRDKLPQSRDIERLFIYQIVNSITQIKGIRFVRFTVDGEIHKDFMGYYDMRDTYKFTYPE